ncbi:unnamed protein product [Aphanomyces euteiches]
MLALSLALVDPSDSELQKELAAWEASPNGQYAARLGLVPKSSQESIMSEDAMLIEKLKRWKAKKAMLPIYAQRNPYAKFTMNTPFALVTKDEAKFIFGAPPPPNLIANTTTAAQVQTGKANSRRLAADIDWMPSGCIHPVQDQGHCGSCWAFGATATIEAAICLSGGGLIKLSEQELVSCAGAGDCTGGVTSGAIDYAAMNGVCLLKDYPYISGIDYVTHDCVKSCTKQKLNIDSSVYVIGEDEILTALQTQPLAVFLYAGEEFMAYQSGILSHCNNQETHTTDHMIVAVATGTDNGVPFIKYKNQWGTWWGEQGYVRLQRQVNACLSGELANYPRMKTPLTTRPPAPYTCSAIEADTDYAGNDVGSTQQASPQACCDDCKKNSACKLFVWYQGTCYLKSAAGTKTSASGRQAGFVSTQPATCSTLEKDTDYTGNDVGSTQRASADLCCADCRANLACKLFVWYQGTCYLKSAAGTKVTLAGRTAGFTQSTSQCSTLQTNTDYYGNDIKSTQRASADLCCDDCKNTPGCQLFVWFQGTCWLKNAKGAQSTKTGATAGFVNFSGPTCGAVEANTDYPGQDLYTARTNDAGGCCTSCINEKACNAYSWTQDGSCYLKSSRANPTAKSGVTSAHVNKCSPVEQGVDYVGNDLYPVVAASTDDCCALCRNANGCKAYSYASGNCYLKTAKGATKANSAASSATTL